MALFKLSNYDFWFPDLSEIDEDQDIVAIGGDLSPGRILSAYRKGIFPWFNPGEPILWWHPVRRMVMKPAEVKISKSSRNLRNQGKFKVTQNQAFEQVILSCQNIRRRGQKGTWISDNLVVSFLELHRRGYAQSFESWQDGNLVGGLYGLRIGDIFCGESMFSAVSTAGKMAFIESCQHLQNQGVVLLDCQVHNAYLASLGAYEVSRDFFMHYLEKFGGE